MTGAVAMTPVGDTRMARFSVVTETAYNGRDGGIIVYCTWFSDGNGAERSCWEIIAHEVEVKEDRV